MDGFASFDQAETALTAAVLAATNDIDRNEAVDLQTELARKKQQYRKKAKQMFKKMRKSVKSN